MPSADQAAALPLQQLCEPALMTFPLHKEEHTFNKQPPSRLSALLLRPALQLNKKETQQSALANKHQFMQLPPMAPAMKSMRSAAAAQITPRAPGRKGRMRIRFRLPRALPVLQRHWFVTGITFLEPALASEDCELCGYWMNLHAGGRAGKPGTVPGAQ